MKKKTINYASPDIEDLEIGVLDLLCQSQLEDVVGDDTEGIYF